MYYIYIKIPHAIVILLLAQDLDTLLRKWKCKIKRMNIRCIIQTKEQRNNDNEQRGKTHGVGIQAIKCEKTRSRFQLVDVLLMKL